MLICQRRWQAQLLIETGATEPFEIVLSLAIVFDGICSAILDVRS